MLALERMGKDPLSVGQIPPTPDIVNQFFNDSTGEGETGGVPTRDFRGPWNEGGDWKYVDAPAFQQLRDVGQRGKLPSEQRNA
jgi:Mn-containing catalase